MNNWYNNLGINPGSVLSLVNKNKLLNELGISSYLSSNLCSFTSETFSPANSMGWKNGMFTDSPYLKFKLSYKFDTYYLYIHTSACAMNLFFVDCKKDQNTTLPALPSFVRCNVPSFCTGITCCIEENKVLRRHFTVGVELDDCNHVMTFQVEQLKIQIKLHDYSFGNPLLF